MLHRTGRAGGAVLLFCSIAAACSTASTPPAEVSPPPPETPREALLPPEAPDPAPPVVRGLGAVSARVPHTTEIVSGVRLASHHVTVTVRDRFARTEVVEELANDTPRVLEGRYTFPVPPGASLARLALWVGRDPVEGEVVERERATAIFDGIVDYVPRPRDPAIVEWVRGSELSLRIFPLPAHGTRKVLLAYEEALPTRAGRVRYAYPLSPGADRSARVGDFSIHVKVDRAGDASAPGWAAEVTRAGAGVETGFTARDFTPGSDFVLTWDDPGGEEATAPLPEDRFVAVRLPVVGTVTPAASPARLDRAVIVDVSHGQSADTLAEEVALATRLVARLGEGERFVLLACDSACQTYPADGLAAASPGALDEAQAWLAQRAPGGSSDLAGALVAAARRIEAGGAGQVVYLGDGAPTSGELAADRIAARVAPEILGRAIDLRLVGIGRTVDEVVLGGIARAAGGAYERPSLDLPLSRRAEDLALTLRAPVLHGARLEVPPGLHDVYPRTLPGLRAGQELLVVGRLEAGTSGALTLRGELDGAPVEIAAPIVASEAAAGPAERLWAAARIAELEGSADPAAAKETVTLSRRHHVLSRRTALLVLENDRMFAEFGIERTRPPAVPDDPLPAGPGPGGRPSMSLGSLASVSSPAYIVGASGAGLPFGNATLEGIPDSRLPLSAFGSGAGASVGSSSPARPSERAVSPERRVPKVQVSAAASGADDAEIARVVRRTMPGLRRCYRRGLEQDPGLTGRVVVRLAIGSNGTVLHADDAGSSLPDRAVVSCVVAALRSQFFPAPEHGMATAIVPVTFVSEKDPRPPPPPAPPIAMPPPPWSTPQAGPEHRAGDDAWMAQGEDALAKLRRAAGEDGASRSRHEALVRGLLSHGRFAEALSAARRFADLDPELPRAQDLLAGAAAAAGQAELARTALDAEVSLSPRGAGLHERAARAFEAAGDEVRACAHWRSIAELRPSADEAIAEALRCRARLGDRDAVLREAAALVKPGKRVTALVSALQAGPSPAYDPAGGNPGEMEVTVRCSPETARCPDVVVVKPAGDVVSPWSPAGARSSAHAVAFSGLSSGAAYRTVLIGGADDAGGEVEIRARDTRRTFRFGPGTARTVAVSSGVDVPSRSWW